MENFFVKPGVASAGGLLVVPDPQTGKPLSAQGENKPKTEYWLHRWRDGDVIEADPTSRDFADG